MYEAQREACIAAALAGGKVALGFFRKLDPAKITEKSRNDLVTEADHASEAAIKAELALRFPTYGFLGEESGASGDTCRRWIVDPLDGTLNFVQGFPHWCISIGLWDKEGGVVGCVYDPIHEDLFVAVRGQGATWNGQKMTISTHHSLEGAFIATGFAYQLGDRFQDYSRALTSVFYRAKGIRRAGSAALDLAHLACGMFDGFFELGLRPWDLAAGVLLVQEAGGLITDWEGGETWMETGNVVAGNLFVHQELLETVRG
nr:inositol monophosphatase family protein [uncultured Holophaga sp.]